jgi:hypothetical protein
VQKKALGENRFHIAFSAPGLNAVDEAKFKA